MISTTKTSLKDLDASTVSSSSSEEINISDRVIQKISTQQLSKNSLTQSFQMRRIEPLSKKQSSLLSNLFHVHSSDDNEDELTDKELLEKGFELLREVRMDIKYKELKEIPESTALKILKYIAPSTWTMMRKRISRDVDYGNIRTKLLFLYKISDADIKKLCLERIISLLLLDPLSSESGDDLSTLLTRLASHLQGKKAEKRNSPIQLLLMKAFAINIELLLIHTGRGNLNAVTENTRIFIKEAMDSLEKLNHRKTNHEFNYWYKYAKNGAESIESDMSDLEILLNAALSMTSTIYDVVTFAKEGGDPAALIVGSMEKLGSALAHFKLVKNWFGQAIAIREMCRLKVLFCNQLDELTDKIRQIGISLPLEEIEIGDLEPLSYAMITTLEEMVIHSNSPHLHQECLILLIQYFWINNLPLQKRILKTLIRFMQEDNPLLKNTAFVLIRLIATDPSQQNFVLNDLLQEEGTYQSHINRLHGMNDQENLEIKIDERVIEFALRRIGDIKGDYFSESYSLPSLLCFSPYPKKAEKLLQTLEKLPIRFLSHNSYGSNAYHIIAELDHEPMFDSISQIDGIDIHQKRQPDQDTPLHVAVRYQSLNVLQRFLEVLTPKELNSINRSGYTPLHEAILLNDTEICTLLIHAGADINCISGKGYSPLALAIETDKLALYDLILSFGGTYQDPILKNVSNLMAVIKQKAENILTSLIKNHYLEFSHSDFLYINRYVTKKNGNSPASSHFRRFHRKFKKTHTNYAINFIECLSARKKWSTEEKKSTWEDKTPQSIDTQLIYADYGNTELILSVIDHKNVDDLIFMVENGEGIHHVNHFDFNVLHAAVINRNIAACELLLSIDDILIDAPDLWGFTPIHYAVLMGDTEIVQLLVEKNADISRSTLSGDTPLLLAAGTSKRHIPKEIISMTKEKICWVESIEILSLLTDSDDSNTLILTRDGNGENAMHRAMKWGSASIVEFLYEKAPRLFFEGNYHGFLPIEEAIESGFIPNFFPLFDQKTLYMLDQQIRDATDKRWNLGALLTHLNLVERIDQLLDIELEQQSTIEHICNSPLYEAAKNGNLEILDLYIQKELPLDFLDTLGNTIAHIAVEGGHLNFMKRLIEQDFPLDQVNSMGISVLHLVATEGRSPLGELLIQFNDLFLLKDERRRSPCHYAAASDNVWFLESCIAIDNNATELLDLESRTPIFYAIERGHLLALKTLVRLGANINHQDLSGQPPIMYACLRGQWQIVVHLLEHFANIYLRDEEGENLIHKLLYINDYKGFKLIVQKMSKNRDSLIEMHDMRRETPIFELVKDSPSHVGDITEQKKILKKLLKLHVNLSQRNDNGETFLHTLVKSGNLMLLVYFHKKIKEMKHGGKYFHKLCNKLDQKENTIIHAACNGGISDVLEYLLEIKIGKALINKRNKEGLTPLMLLIHLGYFDLALLILEFNPNLEKINHQGQNILHLFFQRANLSNRDMRLFSDIATQKPELLIKKDDQKHTPFHYLAIHGHLIFFDLYMEKAERLKKKDQETLIWQKTTEGHLPDELATHYGHYHLGNLIRNYENEMI